MAIALAVAETGCRFFLEEQLAVTTDERNLLYNYDAGLGWFPTPATERRFLAERWIDVRHNSLGLRDVEVPPPSSKRPRIAFFGDSFVWGYDVEAPERFTDLIRARQPGWDVMNCGVSGYGTDQAVLLLERFAPVLRPDVVVLEFNMADRNDNILSENHGGYGKPVFLVENGGLVLANVPVPLLGKARWSESRLYRHSYAWRLFVNSVVTVLPKIQSMEDPTERLIDRMKDAAAAMGAGFVIVLEGADPAIVAHAAARNITLIKVDDEFALHAPAPGIPLRYTGHGAHWTPDGHRIVAQALEVVLKHKLAGASPRLTAVAAGES